MALALVVPGPGSAVSVERASKHFRLRRTHSLEESVAWAVQGVPALRTSPPRPPSTSRSGGASRSRCPGATARGQSTLLKLVAGVMAPDTGRVRVRGRLAGLLEVGAGFHPDLTGRENVHLSDW